MLTTPSLSCDNWVALPDANADGSVILAKNSDRPPMEAQPPVQMPRQLHPSGEKLKCTYIEIPQVTETHEHLGSKLWWAFGYEHGMNEHGVAIGNEAVWSKGPYQWGDGLLGMDLVLHLCRVVSVRPCVTHDCAPKRGSSVRLT
jgi:secernin